MKSLLVLLALICQQPSNRMNGLEKSALTALSTERAYQYRTKDNPTRRSLVWSDLMNEVKCLSWYHYPLTDEENQFLLSTVETASAPYDFEPKPQPRPSQPYRTPAPRQRSVPQVIPPQQQAALLANGVVVNGPPTTEDLTRPKAWYDVIIAGQQMRVWGFPDGRGLITFVNKEQPPDIQQLLLRLSVGGK